MSRANPYARAAPLPALIALSGGCGAATTSPAPTGSPAVQRPAGVPAVQGTWTGCPVSASLDRTALTSPTLGESAALTAIRCRPELRDGGLLVEERAVGIGPLLEALRLPDEQADPQQACTLDLPPVPWVALLDGEGRWTRPGLPADACGQVRAEVDAALTALTWRPVTSRPVG